MWVEDADFVKIQNVTLGYDFKRKAFVEVFHAVHLVGSLLGVELDSVSGHSKRYKITVYDDAGLTETVTFKVSAAGVTRNAVFTVNKIRPGIDGAPGSPGAAATIYRIEPSVTAAKISKDGTATPAYVKCKKTKTSIFITVLFYVYQLFYIFQL